MRSKRYQLFVLQYCAAFVAQHFFIGHARLQGDALPLGLRVLLCRQADPPTTGGLLSTFDLVMHSVTEKRWETYEEVAAYLLNRFAEAFGVGRFEGKQIVRGESGTEWELDAKGVSESGACTIVVECKRHTKSGISQAITGALAFTIQDVDAQGGILVSPLGLQEGARKVAAHTNIAEVTLTPESTTTEYVLRFLNQIHVGMVERVHITDECSIELLDKDGNVIERHKV